MTKLKSIIAVFVFAILTSVVYAGTISEAAQQKIRKEIANHLEDIDLTAYNVDHATIQVTFMVNSQNEIVVLSTDNTRFDRALKSCLNYKSLKLEDNVRNQIYSVPITLKA